MKNLKFLVLFVLCFISYGAFAQSSATITPTSNNIQLIISNIFINFKLNTIKNIFFVFLIISYSAIMSSCEKDDITKEYLIVGRWQGENLAYKYYVNGVRTSSEIEDYSSSFITFNSDGTYKGEDNTQGKLKLGEGTWRLIDNKRIILNDGKEGRIIFTIQTLTKTNMILSFNNELGQKDFSIIISGTLNLKNN